jgi:hypothetical protein
MLFPWSTNIMQWRVPEKGKHEGQTTKVASRNHQTILVVNMWSCQADNMLYATET